MDGQFFPRQPIQFEGRGVPLERDTNFASVQLLLQGLGADGSTSITDKSSFAETVGVVGNTQNDTGQQKFTNPSILFDGNGDYLTCDTAPALGTQDATYEMWFRIGTLKANAGLVDTRTVAGTTAGVLFGTNASSTTLRVNINAADRMTAAVAVSTWYHLAVTRASGVWRSFLDGVQFGSDYTHAASLTSSEISIGTHAGDRAANTTTKFIGNLDQLRITYGVARYTVNFTPPTKAFPVF